MLLAAAGCHGEGQVQLIDSPAVPIGPVTLLLLPELGDMAVADALGWPAGIPGAQVVVHTPSGDRAGITDAAGKLELSLESGSFVVEVNRVLSDAEAQRVPAIEGALGFALTGSLSTGGSGPVSLRVPAARKKGLIISEWAFNDGLLPGVTGYSFGGYLELFNNGDTTVYLDGMLVGEAVTAPFKYDFATCQDVDRLKYDSLYLWTDQIYRFPGRGRDYPVASGGAVVLATDAIDQRPIIANGLDLSHADFESVGIGDVDNPAVPNMIQEGQPNLLGHGFIAGGVGSTVTYLALPVDLTKTPTQRPVSNPPSAALVERGIARASLLDVYSHLKRGGYTFPPCLPLLLPIYDQESASLTGDAATNADFVVSHARRLFVERNGRKYLLWTRSSRTDFMRGTRTIGTVP
jgi:hypothetical protein